MPPTLQSVGSVVQKSVSQRASLAPHRNSTTAHPIHQPKKKRTKIYTHTTVGIRWWSPTQLLIHRS
ncbi:hypothetical protein DL95DRAFT_388331, partial [Leptodontidium sp. 2 PMI_412]